MGKAAGSRRQVPEAGAEDARRSPDPSIRPERELDDIRMLLRELRLRRQLRAQK